MKEIIFESARPCLTQLKSNAGKVTIKFHFSSEKDTDLCAAGGTCRSQLYKGSPESHSGKVICVS